MFYIYKDAKINRYNSVDGNKGKCCETVHNQCFEAIPYLLFKKTQKDIRRHQVRIKTTNMFNLASSLARFFSWPPSLSSSPV